MNVKKYDLFLLVASLAGAIWTWSTKQSIIGYISTTAFLAAALLGLLAYRKNSIQ